MDDENQDSSGVTGLAPCPTCGSAPGVSVLTDSDGNGYSHALPMQLLGSIDVSLARRADGSGHAVVESATGMPLVTGQTAQGTWDAAQDIAALLGRRRMQAAIDGSAPGVTTPSRVAFQSGTAADPATDHSTDPQDAAIAGSGESQQRAMSNAEFADRMIRNSFNDGESAATRQADLHELRQRLADPAADGADDQLLRQAYLWTYGRAAGNAGEVQPGGLPDPQLLLGGMESGGSGIGKAGRGRGLGPAEREVLPGAAGSRTIVDPSAGDPDTPQGYTQERFQNAADMVRKRAAELGLGDDIFVQGSRASKTALPQSDIDFGIRMPSEKFDDFLQNRSTVGRANPGSAAQRTLENSQKNGVIHAGEARMKVLRKDLASSLGLRKADVSVIRAGGNFDSYPQIPIKSPDPLIGSDQ